MRTNKIIIKDCSEDGSNEGFMWELRLAGCPEETIIKNFTYDENTGACYFYRHYNHDTYGCVAYINETCEFI